jgi:hypothetical protein
MSESIGDHSSYEAILSWKAPHKSVINFAWSDVTNFVYFRDYGLEIRFSQQQQQQKIRN